MHLLSAARGDRQACEDVGFFYIRNHGVAPAIIERAYASSAAFHHSSVDAELYRLVAAVEEHDYISNPRLHILSSARPSTSSMSEFAGIRSISDRR